MALWFGSQFTTSAYRIVKSRVHGLPVTNQQSRTSRLASAVGLALWLLFLLQPLFLLRVALLHLLSLLLVALLELLPSRFIGILLRKALVLLLLFLLELLMLLFLFGVEPVLLLAVSLIDLRIACVRRSRPIVRRNFLGMTEGLTVGIASGVWRTIGIVAVAGSVVIGAPIGWWLPAPTGLPGGDNVRAAE